MLKSAICLITFGTLFNTFSQGFQISAGANTIDFNSFTGTGFSPSPVAGQLDSDEWIVQGLSDNSTMTFGDTESGNDFGRGSDTGGVGTGGVYAFDIGSGDIILGVQPGGSDFTPGSFTLRIQNNTGSTVLGIDISYLIEVFNNEDRANSVNFSYSLDNSTYTDVASLDFTTAETADGSPAWQSTSRSTTISGLSLADGDNFYLRWNSDDVSGSGSRDEFGIDDVVITPSSTDLVPPTFISSYPQSQNLNPTNFDLVIQLNEPGTSYYVVLADGASAPSSLQVRNGEDATGTSASISGNFAIPLANTDAISNVTGLTNTTSYDIYIVAEDDEGSPNLQASPILLEVTAGNEFIAITEFMNNPIGSENGAEWIEIYNYGSISVDLNGWTLEDNGGENVTITSSSLNIAPGSFLILANNKTLFETEWLSGVPDNRVVDIPTFVLGNTIDQIILNNNEGSTIWSLAYVDDEVAGVATYLSYTESSVVSVYSSVVRNGNDNGGSTLGYEGVDPTTDTDAFTSSLGDSGSPLAGGYSTPLPVELISFSGKEEGRSSLLSWSTMTETNNEGFYVEKSLDGISFQSLGFVQGNGNANEIINYSFVDHSFLQTSYYRLNQVDFDGKNELSSTIMVVNTNKAEFVIYPNPFLNKVNIDFPSTSFEMTVYNMSGKKIIQEEVTVTQAAELLEGLHTGTYQIHSFNEHFRVSQKLVKR